MAAAEVECRGPVLVTRQGADARGRADSNQADRNDIETVITNKLSDSDSILRLLDRRPGWATFLAARSAVAVVWRANRHSVV